MNRRNFLSAAASLLSAQAATKGAQIRVGTTTNTIGGWEKDVFLSFREAREAGFHYVESFIHYFVDFWDKPEELQRRIDEIGVKFVTISNGGPLETHFEDPSKHEKLLADHMKLVRFIKKFGCTHLKINMGSRRPTGTTDEDLKHMAMAANELGRQSAAENVKLAVHAHMWSQFENRKEIDSVLGNTDPQKVWFVLDTGHITLAGIDPVKLAGELKHRIIEFHIKDTAPEHRGGAKTRYPKHEAMTAPLFFELGKGGVDFPALKAVLDGIGWKGWWNVELDSSPYRPPKESAIISRKYLEKLGLVA